MALTLMAAAVFAVPVTDNNAGTWSDDYSNKIGIYSMSNLLHDAWGGLTLNGLQTTGAVVTVEIQPSSFYGWETVCLEGLYGDSSQITVDVLDGGTLTNVLSGLHPDGSGCIDISSLGTSPASIRLRVTLSRAAAGDPSPVLSELSASWDPKSILLINKSAPATVQAGEAVSYDLRLSVNYVDAINLVLWDTLPAETNGTVIYPAADPESPYAGQNDDPVYYNSIPAGTVWAGPGSTNVYGQTIPAGSVYWAYDQVLAGQTKIIRMSVKSLNGTLNGTIYSNQVSAVAINADLVASAQVETEVLSAPSPQLVQYPGSGLFEIGDTIYALPSSSVSYTLRYPIGPGHSGNEGDETMYDVVLWDDVSGFLLPDMINTNLGDSGFQSISGGGVFDAAYMPPDGSGSVPAIVWTNINDGVFVPGAGYYETFSVTFNSNADNKTINNRAFLGSDQSNPVYSALPVTVKLNTGGAGIYAKGDDLNGSISTTRGRDDDYLLYTTYGDSYDYRLKVSNNGMVGVRDIIMVDMIPTNVALQSATALPAAASGTVFYATTTAYMENTDPPPFDYTAAPTDFDAGTNTLWSATPPVPLSNTTWLAFYYPAVDSWMTMSTSTVPKAAYGDFRVRVRDSAMPCEDSHVDNLALFHSYGLVLPNGTPEPNGESFPTLTDWEITGVKPKQAVFTLWDECTDLSPGMVSAPGLITYMLHIKNRDIDDSDTLLDPYVDVTWDPILIDGVFVYPAYGGLTGGSIDWVNSNLSNGLVRVELNDLAKGDSLKIYLNLHVPSGSADGETFDVRSTLHGLDDLCPIDPIIYPVETARVATYPQARTYKKRDLAIIESSSYITYTVSYENIGTGPSHQTWIVDRVPQDTIFLSAALPNNAMEMRVSDNLLDLPAALSTMDPISLADLATYFTPATDEGGGIWTSPLSKTLWLAYRIDDASIDPPQLGMLAAGEISLTVQNDEGGPDAPTGAGSLPGTQIFNESALLSEELLHGIGNEVNSLIAADPGIMVRKTSSKDILNSGESFEWWIDYYNNSGNEDLMARLRDELPAGVTLLGTRHQWNDVAVANGALPTNTVAVSPTITANVDGSKTIELEIAQTLRGGNLQDLEGGRLILDVQIPPGTPSHTIFENEVCGVVSNIGGVAVACAEDRVEVRNPDLWLRKSATPQEPRAGEVVSYTLLLSNEGLVPAENVSIVATLPAGITYSNGSTQVISPAEYSLGEPDVSGQTLTWSVANGNAIDHDSYEPGYLEALSGNILIVYKGVVDTNVLAGTVLTNIAVTATTNFEDDVYPNITNAVMRTPNPDLTVTKTGPDLLIGGESATWTINYRNLNNENAANVWLIDTLPDFDGDGDVDVTYLSDAPTGPGVSSWYHDGPVSPVPAFDPTNATANASAGWTNSPVGIDVSHIAWITGTLMVNSPIYTIEVTARLSNPEDAADLPPGLRLTNYVVIATTDTDDNMPNNEAGHLLRIPGIDVALEKTGTVEGGFPGSLPEKPLTYTVTYQNSGIVTAYGLKIVDSIPAELSLDDPLDDFVSVVLDEGQLVDPSGDPITEAVPVTRVQSGNDLTWYLGTSNTNDALYYKKVGLTSDAEGSFQIFTTINADVADGTIISNAATIVYDGPFTPGDPEEYLENNTDDTYMLVWHPDLTVSKVGHDTTTGSFETTEAGHFVEYSIEYDNLGDQNAENSVIIDTLPDGTTFQSATPPSGVTYAQLTDSLVQFDLGTVYTLSGSHGVPKDTSLLDGTLIVDGQLDVYSGDSVVLGSDTNGMGTLGTSHYFGYSVAPAGDINDDGVADLVVGAPGNAAAWVLLMEADGTVKTATKLRSGQHGMGTVGAGSKFGYSVAPAGDINDDGVPDLLVGAYHAGAVWVLLMNTNGTVETARELSKNQNGMPPSFGGTNQTHFGYSVASAGDINDDGVPDIVVGAPSVSAYSDEGTAWVLLMNTNGTVKTVTELNHISKPGDMFGEAVAPAEDINGDGVPDLMVGAHGTDEEGGTSFGAIWVMLMQTNGMVMTNGAIEIAYNKNGMSTGLQEEDWFGYSLSPAGDINDDGVPDIVVGACSFGAGLENKSEVWVLLMNADGTVSMPVKLVAGLNGMNANLLEVRFGRAVAGGEDVNGDGVPDLLVGVADTLAGGVWVLLMNPDGTVKPNGVFLMVNGQHGMGPDDIVTGDRFGAAVAFAGDIDGDGLSDVVGSSAASFSRSGEGMAVVMLKPGTYYHTSGTYSETMSPTNVLSWGKLFSDSDVPDSATLFYQILDDASNVVLSAEGPLPSAGLDLSSLSPAGSYTLTVDFATTNEIYTATVNDVVTPTLNNWIVTYETDGVPTITMRVQVDDPVPQSALPILVNNVEISTTSPETDYINNNDDDGITVILTDLAVTKAVDITVAEEGSNLVYTIDWINNGPYPAINAVLTDVLPVGVQTNGASTPPWDSFTGAGTNGNPYIITWDLGTNVAVGASGTLTIPVTVNTNTVGTWLINNTVIANDRQESTYDNNQDNAQTYVGTAVDVWLEKTGPDLLQLGGTNVWTLTVGNAGNVDAPNCVVTDSIPEGLSFVSSVPTNNSLSGTAFDGQTVTWDLGDMARGTFTNILVTLEVSTDLQYFSSSFTNSAIVATSTNETDITNNDDDHIATMLLDPARITGDVWVDDDRDLVWDNGENGVEGVEIVLTGTNYLDEFVLLTNTTDSAGHYSFAGLNPGTYTLGSVSPAGYLDIGATNGTINGVSVGSVLGTQFIEDITVGPGEAAVDNRFAVDLGFIGDRVWLDVNADGIQDLGEPGAGVGVGVRLYDASSNIVSAVVTDALGNYLFEALTGGVYGVEFDIDTLPFGYQLTLQDAGDDALDSDPNQSTGRTDPITLASGDDATTWDAGVALPSSVGNYVWLDEDRDGIQDAGEEGIANVRVGVSNETTAAVLTIRTDAQGEYLFSGLPIGDYSVWILDSNLSSGGALKGKGQTTNAVRPNVDLGNQTQPYSITLLAGKPSRTADFGYNANPGDDPDQGAIGDCVWLDINGDGAKDAGEIGISDVRVVLYGDPDSDGTYDTPVATNTTDATGQYLFTNLVAAAYVIGVDTNTLSVGLTQTGDPDELGSPASTPDNQTTTPLLLAPGDVFVNADFGYQPATGYDIGDSVWLDLNADGTNDIGESGISGVSVNLIDDSNGNGAWDAGEPIIATVSSDENGEYLFSGLPDGDYLVHISDVDNVLGGLEQTSDPDSKLDATGALTLSGVDNLDQDFGYSAAGHSSADGLIGDTIFYDRNNSGSPEAGEGLPGVTVMLSDTNGTVVAVDVTDANGFYLFGGFDSNSTYTVTVDTNTIPAGLINTVDPDGGSNSTSSVDLSLAVDGIDLDQDFGYNADPSGAIGSIGDRVWLDADADGIADSNEVGIAGVTIDLYSDGNGNGLMDPGEPLIATTTTVVDGSYSFTNLPAETASYVLDVTDTAGALAGHWHSLGTAGVDNNSQADGYGFTLTPVAPDNTTADFGYYVTSAALGNRVWWDTNANGAQDDGEDGFPSIEVYLQIVYPGGTTNRMTTVSDTNGFYSFSNLMLDENFGTGGTDPVFTLSVENSVSNNHTFHNMSGVPESANSDNPSGVIAIPYRGLSNVAFGLSPTNEHAIASYDFGFTDQPTLAVITGVRSRIEDGVAVISWDVSLELETAGYYLERKLDGAWVRINAAMIPSQIFVQGTKTYSQADPEAPLGTVQIYRIVEVDFSGRHNHYGPYELELDGGEVSFDRWATGIDWNGADASANADPDGDGLSNFREYMAGTNPLDVNSVLRITRIAPTIDGFHVSWLSETGRVYTVEMTPSLAGTFWAVATGIEADPPKNTVRIPISEEVAEKAFFRVLVE